MEKKMEVNACEKRVPVLGVTGRKRRVSITIDSGVAVSVTNEKHFPEVKTLESDGSRCGVEYVNANGATMPNRGQKLVPVRLSGENVPAALRLQVTDVERTLLSVSKVCDSGHEVTFRNNGVISSILNQVKLWLNSGEKMECIEQMRMWGGNCFGFQQARVTNWSSISPSGIDMGEIGDLEGEGDEMEEIEKEGRRIDEPVEVCKDEVGQDQEEVEFREFETSIAPNVVADLGAPSTTEVAEHNLTHLPHRSWCPICIEARGKDRPHRRVDRSNHEVIELHF